MTNNFDTWWDEPVIGSHFTKEEMKEHIIQDMGEDAINFKIAMRDAYLAGMKEVLDRD